ncbi:MAG: hypothetical protein ACOCVQ_00945 [Bacillota bacterium]
MLRDGDFTPERRDELIEWAAQRIFQWEMVAPAIMLFDGFRPVSFVASQGMHMLAPFSNILTGHPYATEVAYLLQDRDNLDRLVERLEDMVEEEERAAREARRREKEQREMREGEGQEDCSTSEQ